MHFIDFRRNCDNPTSIYNEEKFIDNENCENRTKTKRKAREPPKMYTCFHCPQTFLGAKVLSNHITQVHGGLGTMNCNYCGQWYLRQDSYIKHLTICECRNQEEGTAWLCPICKQSFATVKFMKNHLASHNPMYKCNYCDMEFSKNDELKAHKQTHTENTFLCSICGTIFMTSINLNKHMKRHFGIKEFRCSFCSKAFVSKGEVQVHERYHTGVKKRKCQICEKEFNRAISLVVHMRTHTGEKPYQCTHCERSFAQSQDLKTHIRRHTGERFKCNLCERQYIQNYQLTRHLKVDHGLEVEAKSGRLEKVQIS